MESFENQKNKSETILNDWDKKVLLEGGAEVIKKIIKQEGIPNIIILPDTAARPLFYLVDASFKKLAKSKNMESPRYIFLAPTRPDSYTTSSESAKAFEDNTKEFLIDIPKEDILSDRIETYNMFNISVSKEELGEMQSKIDHTYNKRIPLKEYSLRLLDTITSKYGPNSKMIILDEFSSNGATALEIQRAFGMEIPAYSVFSMNSSNISQDNTGIIISTENEDTANPLTNSHTSLSYKDDKLKKSLGVEKHEGLPIVTVLNKNSEFNEEHQKMISTLRNEMKDLGKEISEHF